MIIPIMLIFFKCGRTGKGSDLKIWTLAEKENKLPLNTSDSEGNPGKQHPLGLGLVLTKKPRYVTETNITSTTLSDHELLVEVVLCCNLLDHVLENHS